MQAGTAASDDVYCATGISSSLKLASKSVRYTVQNVLLVFSKGRVAAAQIISVSSLIRSSFILSSATLLHSSLLSLSTSQMTL